jgi:hypothetical protein
VEQVEGPATVLVTALEHDFDGFADALVRLDSGVAQIVEAAQDVVVPKRGEGKAEPRLLDDFAGAKRTEHAALEEIILGTLAGAGDCRRFAAGAFVVEKAFENADGGVEGRATAFGRFTVPAAVLKLLGEELIGERVVGLLEIGADAEDAAVDAGLGFAMEIWAIVEPLEDEMFVDAGDHAASLFAGGVEAEVFQGGEAVEGDEKVAMGFGHFRPPRSGAATPVALWRLAREEFGPPAFGGDTAALSGDDGGRGIGEVLKDLPADGGVGVEEPI